MGSLYDIGNFRYRHFTFYSCDSDGSEEGTCSEAPAITLTDPDKLRNDELINFLDRVWPHKGLFIGDSSEGDYGFVTYVTQSPTNINVKNIYVYKRVRSLTETASTMGGTPEFKLVWERLMEPVQTLKPGVSI